MFFRFMLHLFIALQAPFASFLIILMCYFQLTFVASLIYSCYHDICNTPKIYTNFSGVL